MISVSSKETQKIFLTVNTKAINLSNEKIDLIVSPEFYWVRKFEIPVKSETQARHVLPTLFEDIIEDTSVMTYQVIKLEDNQFLCFAYNNKRIYEAIKKSNIPTSLINALYFAQNECKSFKSFEVDSLKYMYTSEDILVKVPKGLDIDVIALQKVINNIQLSSYKIQIKLYNDVIGSKFYYIFFAIFAVLILMNSFKYFSFSSEISSLENKIEELKVKNKLPATMIQTNSILKDYESQVLKEKEKREAIAYIVSNSKFDLKSLRVEDNQINLQYLSVNKNEVEKFLKKRFKQLNLVENSFTLKVSIKL